MLNTTTPNKILFTGESVTAFAWYVNQNGVHHYEINSLLYLKTLRKNIQRYEEFILQL